MTRILQRVLAEHFAIEAERLTHLDVVAHNQHFVAVAPEGSLHLTLHDLPEGSAETEELEEVHDIVARLDDPTTALASSLRRGVSGRFLEPTPLGHLTVRRHVEETSGSLSASQLVSAAVAHSHALAAAVPAGCRLRTGAPRFACPADTLDAVATAVDGALSPWLSRVERRQFGKAVDDVWRSAVIASDDSLRPVHGDLDVSNVLGVDGAAQIIDHGCMHWDVPLYDLAHLLLSFAASGHFCGPLDAQRTEDFLSAVRVKQESAVSELIDTCCYVLLEKLTTVDRRAHLLAEPRLATIAELRTLQVT